MREIRQSGSVGGETLTRLPYLNQKAGQADWNIDRHRLKPLTLNVSDISQSQ